jgi:hypothetical protein
MPNAVVHVQVRRVGLSKVSVTSEAGDELAREGSGQAWSSTARMKPDTSYTVAVTAAGPQGGVSTQTSTFTTHKPAITATYGIVYDQQTWVWPCRPASSSTPS